MNIALWIAQGVLAAIFLMAGMRKVITPKEKLAERMKAATDHLELIRALGIVEVLGAIGIIIPYATGILPIFTVLAAAGFLIVLIGAIFVHARKKENFIPQILFLVLAIFVIYGRV